MSDNPDASPQGDAGLRYQQLVANIDGIVWEADARTLQFTFVSRQAERVLGYPLGRWLAPGFWVEHIHPDDRDRVLEACRRAIDERSRYALEARLAVERLHGPGGPGRT